MVVSRLALVLLCCIIPMLAGCSGMSKPTNFFMLSSIEASDVQQLANDRELSILVGPVTVPAYLDRKQIIVRQPDFEVDLFDFDHWAEPLQSNLKRVLITNLSSMLTTAKVYDFDRRNVSAFDYQLEIDIKRFDSAVGGISELLVFWSVMDPVGNIVVRERTELKATAEGTEVKHQVAALNELFSDFSQILGQKVVSLERQN